MSLPLGTTLGSLLPAPGFGKAAGTIAASIPGASAMPGYDLAKKIFGIETGMAFLPSGATIVRIVTGLLGLLLIAAAIFTHPTVINVTKRVGKAAAKAGEAAAVAA